MADAELPAKPSALMRNILGGTVVSAFFLIGAEDVNAGRYEASTVWGVLFLVGLILLLAWDRIFHGEARTSDALSVHDLRNRTPLQPAHEAASQADTSDLKLTVGESGQFFKTQTYQRYTTRRTYLLRCENVSRSIALTKCRITLNSIATQTEYVGPWVVEEGFDLAPGDHRFVPLISYGEPRYPASGSESFMEILPAGPNAPKPSSNSAHVLEIRATGISTSPFDFCCKVWVDENKQLRIQEIDCATSGSLTVVPTYLSLQDAAQEAYNCAEIEGWLDGVVGRSPNDPALRLESFKYMMLIQAQHHVITLHGIEPPSTQSLPIPQQKTGGLHPATGESALRYLSPNQIAFHTVTISHDDLAKVIAIYRALATHVEGATEYPSE